MNTESIATYTLELARPWMLWTLLVLAPIAWYYWKSLSDFPLWQRRVSWIIRSSIVVLLALALAGLTLLKPTKQMFVVFAIDRSQSVDASANATIEAYLNEARTSVGRNSMAVLEFAADQTPASELNTTDQRNAAKARRNQFD